MKEALSFEEAFERLEAAVAALQDGQMPLARITTVRRRHEAGTALQ